MQMEYNWFFFNVECSRQNDIVGGGSSYNFSVGRGKEDGRQIAFQCMGGYSRYNTLILALLVASYYYVCVCVRNVPQPPAERLSQLAVT